MSWQWKFLLLLSLFNLIVFFCCFLDYQENNKPQVVKSIKPLSISRYKLINYEKPKEVKKIHILFWKSEAKKSGTWMKPGTVTFEEGNCIFTHNQKLLNSTSHFDAIVFNPFLKNETYERLPLERSDRQLYILYAREVNVRNKLELDENFYNLTWTYKLNSDFVWLYGKTIKRKKGKYVAPKINVNWEQQNDNFTDPALLKQLSNKTKLVSWMASHCPTSSRREVMVKSLQKFIPVDIFGRCGNLTCSTKGYRKAVCCLKPYKFYLSFENTLCPDYVTEKLYKIMFELIIPVVFSGADMSRFLPPKSYINANDFATTKDLADYLKFLSENPEEFIKYFWWRKFYKIFTWYMNDYKAVCSKIESLISSGKRKTYGNVKGWFNEGCSSTKIKF